MASYDRIMSRDKARPTSEGDLRSGEKRIEIVDVAAADFCAAGIDKIEIRAVMTSPE